MDELEEGEEKEMAHTCANENKIMVKIIVGVFTAIVAIYPICSTVITSALDDHAKIQQLKLDAIKDDVKRNELRTARVEAELISSNKSTSDHLSSMVQGINDLNTNFSNLKYIYATNSRLDEELKKKVDYSRIDKRNLKD